MLLAERLKQPEAVLCGWSHIPDPLTVETLARTGFDAICLDMQHGGHNEDSVLRSIGPIRLAGRHPLVRIPVGRFDMASRALDFGAEAVIAPMVNSVDDARRFAAAMKYPPVGERSWGPGRAVELQGAASGSAFLHAANANTLALAMIETREAFEILDRILETDGIDGVFLGPSDFSIAWSGGKVVDAGLDDMMEAVGQIAARTAEAGKVPAIFFLDPGLCGRFEAMGYRIMASGTEGQVMTLGARSLIGDARAAMRGA